LPALGLPVEKVTWNQLTYCFERHWNRRGGHGLAVCGWLAEARRRTVAVCMPVKMVFPKL
jgi:hypothetical protein